jgi:ABC-type antimicrobial peptide transport system permease subunit
MMFILWHSALLVGSMAIAFVAGFITARQLSKKAIED